MYINIRVQWIIVHKMGCTIKTLQYDPYKIKILNELLHITLLYTINICAE